MLRSKPWFGYVSAAVFGAGLFLAGLGIGRGQPVVGIPEGWANGVALLDRAPATNASAFTSNAEGNVLYVWTFNAKTRLYDAVKFDFATKLYETVKFGEVK